jgi:hypothetical protein
MDLSTMCKKLDNCDYIRNCFLLNPAGTPINQAGIELQRLFDDKWRALPIKMLSQTCMPTYPDSEFTLIRQLRQLLSSPMV